jgi:acyl carrier protein
MEEKILQILRDVQPDFAFEDGVDFVEEGYLDSFDIVTLVSDLESEFNILISALEIVPENFGSVRAIAALVAKSEKRAL